MPAAFALFSFSPVVATVISNSFSTAEPCVPLYSEAIPAILSAAMRPCLFAGPARGINAGVFAMKSSASAASPTA